MNLNQLAILISKKEGLKKQVNIAQIKEIIKVIGQIIRDNPFIVSTNVRNPETIASTSLRASHTCAMCTCAITAIS
jgi:hypothetical protein